MIDRETDIESSVGNAVRSFSLDDVPEVIRERARLVLLDTVGVCIRGAETDYVTRSGRTFAEFCGLSDDGRSTVLTTREHGSPLLAAQMNAAGGTTLELDEGNSRSGHMGIHVVPSALAVGEHLGATGRELLEAIVVAYEISARLGNVVRPLKRGLHPHGVWSPTAGAVATAHLLELDANQCADALRIAANPFFATHWAASLEGATVRNYYTGLACGYGIQAALLASSGVTGVSDATYRCLLPYTAREQLPRETVAERFETIGEAFFIENSYFKIHAACRYTHAPVEALVDLAEEHDIGPENVDRITVKTHENGALLTETRPENPLSAKFSTPYVLAARLLLGSSGVDAFTLETVRREDVRSLADRIDVVEDEAYDDLASEGYWGAKVQVETSDGTIYVEARREARGGGESPFSSEEIHRKFDDLVVDVTSRETATDLRETLLDIESVEDVSTLLNPLL